MYICNYKTEGNLNKMVSNVSIKSLNPMFFAISAVALLSGYGHKMRIWHKFLEALNNDYFANKQHYQIG